MYLSELNDDLLREILLILPLKSVARLKSVSKQFLRLISTTPQFDLPKPLNTLISHCPSQIHTPHLLPLHHHDSQRSLSLNHTFNTVISTHSCNGLLLCCLLDRKTHRASLSKIIVSNPITNHHATLPLKYPRFFHTISAYLAFHPKLKPQFDVVCFCTSGRSDTHVMVYSSQGKKKWTIVGALQDRLRSFGGGVFYNGYIYWASRPLHPDLDPATPNKLKLSLYRFNVERGSMERVALPCESDFDYLLYLGLCRGRLHVVTGVYDSGSRYDIGVMNVYEAEEGTVSDGWRLRYSLGNVATDLRREYRQIKVVPTVDPWSDYNVCKVVFFNPEERCLYFEIGKLIARYDFGAGTVAKVCHHYHIGWPYIACYSQHMEILYSA